MYYQIRLKTFGQRYSINENSQNTRFFFLTTMVRSVVSNSDYVIFIYLTAESIFYQQSTHFTHKKKLSIF